MNIIEPQAKVIDYSNMMKTIERGGRICYKSEDKIGPGSDVQLIEKLKSFKHESVLEHSLITVQIITDRGVTHELVRHRLCAFSQESTRYCNYSKGKFNNEITVIRPFFWDVGTDNFAIWKTSCDVAEHNYMTLLNGGAKPQEARSILPNSLKTEIQVSANVREWNHIFKLRTHRDAHPQIQQIMIPLAKEFQCRWPSLFSDYSELTHPSPATIIWEV
jgi:thymidylate synthase (FAD)